MSDRNPMDEPPLFEAKVHDTAWRVFLLPAGEKTQAELLFYSGSAGLAVPVSVVLGAIEAGRRRT